MSTVSRVVGFELSSTIPADLRLWEDTCDLKIKDGPQHDLSSSRARNRLPCATHMGIQYSPQIPEKSQGYSSEINFPCPFSSI